MLFACPYNTTDISSEYLNGYVKLMVKKRCHKHRTILELKNDIRDGFYGGKTRILQLHEVVNTRMAKRRLKKMRRAYE